MPFTSAGYQRRTYAEWVERDEERAKQIFGSEVDTSEASLLGKFIRLDCEDKAELEEEAEDIVLSSNYKTASGAALRRLCANVFVTASAGTAAQYTVSIKGTPGTTIEEGTLFTSSADTTKQYYAVNPVTIADDGTATVLVECTEVGTAGVLESGTIDSLAYTDGDIESITGASLVTAGEDGDSDAALRGKYEKARSASGSGTYEAVVGALYQIDGVQAVTVTVNDTLTDGAIPAKSYCVSVLGAKSLAAQIAQTIFQKGPLTAATAGDETEKVVDQWGDTHEVKFSWMTETLIYVYVKILIDSDWTSSSEESAKEAIAEHINALAAHATVYANDLYTTLKDIPGKVNVMALQISKTGFDSMSTDDIEIGTSEVAKTSTACIKIETAEA